MRGLVAVPGGDGASAASRGRVAFAVVSAFLAFAAALATSPLAPSSASSAGLTPAVQLTGGGVAFVIGGSGIPFPSEGYVNAADELYLQPHGFTGTAQSLFTPQLYYPGNLSMVQGAQILAQAINKEIATGQVNSENPVYVFGYSQSSAMASMTMEQLNHQGVSAEDIRFVLVGNSANPNGGILQSLNLWGGNLTFWNGLALGHPTPDYFTTDVYTMEYDGFAHFPQYPLNLLSTLNAVVGMFLVHNGHFGLSAADIANAIPLETTNPDSLTNYYMIPTATLPLLDLLRLNPVWGNPLAALLEPSMRILVNLGYGSLTESWNQGPANVPTALSLELLPSHISWDDINAALVNAWSEGVGAAVKELQNPATYVSGAFLEQGPFSILWNAAQRVFFDIQNPLPAFGGWFGGSAMATDPTSTLDSDVDGQLDLSWLTDFLGLDAATPA